MHGICLFIYFSESSVTYFWKFAVVYVNELKLDICIVFGRIIKCECQIVKMMYLICWPFALAMLKNP